MPHVNFKPEVVQKIRAKNSMLDIGNPPEGVVQPYVEGEGAYTKRRDVRAIDSLHAPMSSGVEARTTRTFWGKC